MATSPDAHGAEGVIPRPEFSTPPAKDKDPRKQHSPYSELVFGSPREAELSNSLVNLKLGFKQREEQLQTQLAIHKEAIYELYRINKNLRLALASVGSQICDQSEEIEELVKLGDEHGSGLTNDNSDLQSRLNELQNEKTQLEKLNLALQEKLNDLTAADHFQNGLDSSHEQCNISDDELRAKTDGENESSPTSDLKRTGNSKDKTEMNSSPTRTLRGAKPSEERRRHSSGDSMSSPNKRHKSNNASVSSQKSASHTVQARKPAVPRRDEFLKVRKSFPSNVPKQPRRTSLPSANPENVEESTNSDYQKRLSRSTFKPPRESLRSRIEAHARENNPWLGAFSTTNRTSSGGCLFFVDMHSSGADRHEWEVTECESGDNRRAEGQHMICGSTSNEDGIQLLKLEDTDLQNLSFCSSNGGETPQQQTEFYDSAIGNVSDSNYYELDSTSTLPKNQITLNQESSLANAPYSAELHSNSEIVEDTEDCLEASTVCRVNSIEGPSIHDCVGMSLVDSIQHDEANIDEPNEKGINDHTLHNLQATPAHDDMSELFLELHDIGVQCDTCRCDAESNTDINWLEHVMVTSQVASRNQEIANEEKLEAEEKVRVTCRRISNETLANAIEETKLSLGKKLFELRYGSKKVLAPPTPLPMRKPTKLSKPEVEPINLAAGGRASPRSPRFPSFSSKLISSPTATSLSKNLSSPTVSSSVPEDTNNITLRTTLAASGNNACQELNKLHVELLSQLRREASFSNRCRRKVELLEVKLCRLIMYVKNSAKNNFMAERVDASFSEQQPAPDTRTGSEMSLRAQVPKDTSLAPNRRGGMLLTKQSAALAAHKSAVSALASANKGSEQLPRPLTKSQRHTPSLVRQNDSMNVGSMSFNRSLDQLLALEENEEEHVEDEMSENDVDPEHEVSRLDDKELRDISFSLFSPVKDFQGRNYDDLSESNISAQSNPLLRRVELASSTPAESGMSNSSHLDLSFHQERSFVDTPEQLSPGASMTGVHACSPIRYTVQASQLTPTQPRELFPSKAISLNGAGSLQGGRGIGRGGRAFAEDGDRNRRGGRGPVSSRIIRDPGVNRNFPIERNNVMATSTSSAMEQELQQAHKMVEGLEKTVDYLKLRTKHLSREKQLLTTKLQHALDNDVDSFQLQIYTSNDEISLNNPTRTMKLVMGFLENNNTLLDEIGALKEQLADKTQQGDVQSREIQELREALSEAQRNNRALSEELEGANNLCSAVRAEQHQMQRQVGELTYSMIHLSQENKLLKERIHLY